MEALTAQYEIGNTSILEPILRYVICESHIKARGYLKCANSDCGTAKTSQSLDRLAAVFVAAA